MGTYVPIPAAVVIAVLPALKLGLSEERLARLAPSPIVPAINLRVPFKVVVRLAETLSLRGVATIAGR